MALLATALSAYQLIILCLARMMLARPCWRLRQREIAAAAEVTQLARANPPNYELGKLCRMRGLFRLARR